MKLPLLIILLILSTACMDPIAEELPREVPGKANQAGNGKSFEIKKGESLSLSEFPLQLSLLNLKDSRCPADVQCIQAGEVSVLVNVISSQNSLQYLDKTLCLGCKEENDSISFDLDLHKYLLILKNVSPYPNSSNPQTGKGKTAELEIQLLE